MCKLYREVLRLVADETEISSILIESKSRLADVVDARQMVVWFCFKAGVHPRKIAEFLGISRQAVCQKVATIDRKRLLRSFDFVFRKVERRLAEILTQ